MRPTLSIDQEEFLGSIAQVIVTHMEVGREAEERKKATKMSRGLNAFVEGKDCLCAEDSILDGWSFGQRAAAHVGKSQFKEFPNSRSRQISTERLRAGEKMRSHHVDTDTVKGSLDSGTNNVPSFFTRALQPPDLLTQTTLSSDQDTSQDESDSRSVLDNKDTGHSQTFLRAAKLLRESLDLQIGGGTVFLDAAVGFHGLDQDISNNITSWDGAIDKNNVASCDLRSQNRRSSSTITARTYRHSMQSLDFETSKKLYRAAEIISFSVDELIPNTQDQSQGLASFTPLGEEQLQILLKRYPRGKLWSFDEDGGLSSEEEELSPKNANGSSNSKQLGCTRELDAKMLQNHFPSGKKYLKLFRSKQESLIRSQHVNYYSLRYGILEHHDGFLAALPSLHQAFGYFPLKLSSLF